MKQNKHRYMLMFSISKISALVEHLWHISFTHNTWQLGNSRVGIYGFMCWPWLSPSSSDGFIQIQRAWASSWALSLPQLFPYPFPFALDHAPNKQAKAETRVAVAAKQRSHRPVNPLCTPVSSQLFGSLSQFISLVFIALTLHHRVARRLSSAAFDFELLLLLLPIHVYPAIIAA